ncbi:MAG: ABC transporter substrate-binding protein [Treponema sp.]|nr:ABC transporter substrate-binding protein [Treponema sp.]
MKMNKIGNTCIKYLCAGVAGCRAQKLWRNPSTSPFQGLSDGELQKCFCAQPPLHLLNKNIVHLFLFFFTIVLLLLTGCTNVENKEIRDRSGRTVVIKNQINRVISTAPSNTEIIVDIGQADKLVAIDKHSANVSGIPADLQGKLPLLDFFYPDAEVIINLSPDLIIASGHNPSGSGEDPFRLISEMGVPVVYISMSKSIEDIYLDIKFIAEVLKAGEEGEKLVRLMRSQVDEIARKAAGIENKQTVYFEISAAPDMMTFGKDSFISDMISVISAINVFGNDNWLVTPGAEAVIARNPGVILTNVNYIDNPIAEIKNRPGFNHISAVQNNRVYQIDTDSSVRPSARVVFALRQMQEAVYPGIGTQEPRINAD